MAKLARNYAAPDREVRAATVNGAAGAVIFVAGRAAAIMGFVVRSGRITTIDVLADPERIANRPERAGRLVNPPNVGHMDENPSERVHIPHVRRALNGIGQDTSLSLPGSERSRIRATVSSYHPD